MAFVKSVWKLFTAFVFISFGTAHSHNDVVEEYLKEISVNAWTVGDDLNDEVKNQENSNKTKPEYLYSNRDIIKLAGIEEDIYKAMKKYVTAVDRRLNLMKLYMKDYEQSSVNTFPASVSLKNYALIANPILTHRLIKRFADDFVEIISTFAEGMENEEFLEAINAANPSGLIYPSPGDDYGNSMKSLLRIQHYNNFNPADMSEGILGNLKTGIGLHAKHAFDLGVFISETKKDFAYGIEWLEMALQKIEGDMELQNLDPLFRERAESYLKKLMIEHDKICPSRISANVWNADFCFTKPLLEDEDDKNMGTQNRTKVWTKRQLEYRAFYNTTPWNYNHKRVFEDLCSGNILMPISKLSKLHCWYEHKKHPYFIIAPAKFELLNDDPPVYQIHEMIGPQRTKRVLQTASRSVRRSRVINYTDPNRNDISEARTSSTTLLYPEDKVVGKDLKTMSREIEFVSGLRVVPPTAGEALQFGRYRTSHHYDEHLDAFGDPRRNKNDGDRIATFMYYFNDVDAGGFTGFPMLGISGKPVAGSGLLWFNLKRNGVDRDLLMHHGGCPVVHGVKWVATKWIRLYDNFNKMPCSLDPDK